MILDNQYLLSIAETGVIGLAAMVVVILSTADGGRAPDPRPARRAGGVHRRALRDGRLRRHGGHVRRPAVQPGERAVHDRGRDRRDAADTRRGRRRPSSSRRWPDDRDPRPRRVRHPPVRVRRAARRLAAGPRPRPPPPRAVGRSAGRAPPRRVAERAARRRARPVARSPPPTAWSSAARSCRPGARAARSARSSSASSPPR